MVLAFADCFALWARVSGVCVCVLCCSRCCCWCLRLHLVLLSFWLGVVAGSGALFFFCVGAAEIARAFMLD